MKSSGEVAPVRGALHQFGEQFVRFSIFVESLRPKMTWISHHYFSTVEEQWVIIGRPGRETRFERHFANGEADRIHFAAIGETETVFTGGQTAKQTHEPGSKKRKANRRANRQLPLRK